MSPTSPTSPTSTPAQQGETTTAPFEVPTLETPRLRLRPLREEDFPAYAEIVSDAQTMLHVGGAPLERESAWRQLAFFVGHWQLRGFGMWGVEEKEGSALIGRVGLHRPDGWPGIEIGWLVRRSHWGRGYAPEAARAGLRHGFESLGLDRLISLIMPDNHASIRVAEKIGETYESVVTVMGRSCQLYSISRQSWVKIQGEPPSGT